MTEIGTQSRDSHVQTVEEALPSEWEVTAPHDDHTQAIIPADDDGDPDAIVQYEAGDCEYHVVLAHESLDAGMGELMGSAAFETVATKSEAVECLSRFAHNYRALVAEASENAQS